MPPTFFLGLGGQKCGSSWMQAYLARQIGSDFGRLGEYQIWESDLGGPFARYKVKKPSNITLARANLKRRLGGAVPKDVLRWEMQRDRARYFTYFAKLLARDGITRTGDVTPSYAALPAPMLAGIRDGFAAKDIETRAFFAMRDPVDRLRSHLRMDQQKGYLTTSGSEADDLAAFYAGPEAAARMRYDLTLAAMEEVFAPEHRFITLFEALFTEAGTHAFADWAGVAVEPDAGGQKINARSTGDDALPEDLTAQIARHYAPVYAAVAERLPQIATLWPSAKYVL